MQIEIVKDNYKKNCAMCYNKIETKHKVEYANKHYHLSCFYGWLNTRLIEMKKAKKKLNRYKKYFMMEKL